MSGKCALGVIASVVACAVLFTFAVFGPDGVNTQLVNGIRTQLLLTEQAMKHDELGWHNFERNDRKDDPFFFNKVYMWNTTNPTEVMNGAKPILQEVGPYVFRANRVRFNFTFGKDDAQARNVVKFNQRDFYLFSRELTPKHLDPDTDLFVVPNIASLGAIFTIAPQLPDFLVSVIESLNLTDYDLWFMKHSVNQIVYARDLHDPILDSVGMGALYPGVQRNESIEDASSHPPHEMYIGDDEISLARQIYKWRGMKQIQVPTSLVQPDPLVDVWGSADANRVTGTDGTAFAPLNVVQPGVKVNVWEQDLYRKVTLMNPNKQTFKPLGGVELLKFISDPLTRQNATINPLNADYWGFGANGVWNCSSFQYQPIAVSLPHMYLMQADIAEKIVGQHPDPKLHELVVGVEPETGLTMYARKRFQVNVVHDGPLVVSNTTFFPNILPGLYHPLCWIEYGADIPKDMLDNFKRSIGLAEQLQSIIKFGGFAFGILFALIAVGCIWLAARANRKVRGLGMNEGTDYQVINPEDV